MSVVAYSAVLLAPTRLKNRPKLPRRMPPSENSSKMMNVGFSQGSTMKRMRWNAFAPSISEASMISLSSPIIAAK